MTLVSYRWPNSKTETMNLRNDYTGNYAPDGDYVIAGRLQLRCKSSSGREPLRPTDSKSVRVRPEYKR